MTQAATAFERPAVLIVNRLGDQLFSLPAMRALASIFPDGLQLFLGEDMRAFFYRGLPLGAPAIVRWRDGSQHAIDVDRTAHAAAPCDLLVCLSPHPWTFVGPLAERLGVRWTVGYGQGLHDQLRPDHTHAFERLFAIARRLQPQLDFDDFTSPPVFSPAAEAAAVRFLNSARGSWRRVLFVHPETAPDRMWAQNRLAWVLERFLGERGDFIVFVASLEPIDLGGPTERIRWIDQHLELTLALVRHMDLFLGIDSCFLHAADLFRVPGVALFGPTLDWEKGFRFSPHGRHVTAETMDAIPREQVLDALLEAASVIPRLSVDA